MQVIFYITGETFSYPWVSNWSDTLSVLASNKHISFKYKFMHQSDKYLENNLGIFQDINDLNVADWVVFLSNEVIWHPAAILHILQNQTYDAITGWHMNESGKTEIVRNLNENDFLHKNIIEYMTPDQIQKQPLPFRIEYCNLNFFAIKGEIIREMNYPWFTQVILNQESSVINYNSITFPWYYSFCKKFNSLGKEIYLDPTLRINKISKSLI